MFDVCLYISLLCCIRHGNNTTQRNSTLNTHITTVMAFCYRFSDTLALENSNHSEIWQASWQQHFLVPHLRIHLFLWLVLWGVINYKTLIKHMIVGMSCSHDNTLIVYNTNANHTSHQAGGWGGATKGYGFRSYTPKYKFAYVRFKQWALLQILHKPAP